MPSENAAMQPRVKYAPAKKGVGVAKRICDQAKPGQILVSDVVQRLATGKGFTFTERGEACGGAKLHPYLEGLTH